MNFFGKKVSSVEIQGKIEQINKHNLTLAGEIADIEKQIEQDHGKAVLDGADLPNTETLDGIIMGKNRTLRLNQGVIEKLNAELSEVLTLEQIQDVKAQAKTAQGAVNDLQKSLEKVHSSFCTAMDVARKQVSNRSLSFGNGDLCNEFKHIAELKGYFEALFNNCFDISRRETFGGHRFVVNSIDFDKMATVSDQLTERFEAMISSIKMTESAMLTALSPTTEDPELVEDSSVDCDPRPTERGFDMQVYQSGLKTHKWQTPVEMTAFQDAYQAALADQKGIDEAEAAGRAAVTTIQIEARQAEDKRLESLYN